MRSGALLWFSGCVALLLAAALFTSSSDRQGASLSVATGATDGLPQQIHSVELGKHYSFAGEELPMKNFDVRERLDREFLVNSYYHSNTLLSIKMAYRHFPAIEKILAEEGLPDDLKYLAVAESSLLNAGSHAGAEGVWQFLEGTGKEYGLEINDEVDERYHLEKSTRAACQMFRKLHERFGSWTLSATAYNMGASRLAQTIEQQRSNSFFDLNLSSETNRYLFRIVAIKEILSRPADFGFYLERSQLYPPLEKYKTIEVNGPVDNWGDFAKEHGTTYRLLKVYNPWLHSHKLTNKEKKTYEVRVAK